MADKVTRIVPESESDAQSAAEDLLPLVYAELQRLAAIHLAKEKPGQTLQATALVHEAYLRLIGSPERKGTWNGRGHFFAAAAEAMRRILVDRARYKNANKRGGGRHRVDLAEDLVADEEQPEKLLALEAALLRLEECEPRKAQLVKLRFFAGLTIHKAAEAMDISTTTAERYWNYARAWLQHEMRTSDK